MPSHVDARPPGVNLLYRPGTTLTLSLEWPTGELAGRSFSSTLDGVALAVTVNGDTMTVEASAAITEAADAEATWLLLEDLGGVDPEAVMVGTWAQSAGASTVSPSASYSVVTGQAVTVEVTVLAGGALADLVDDLSADLDALDLRVDAVEASTTSLDARLDVIEASGTVRPFVSVEQGWAARWQAIAAAASSRLVRAVVFGDSIGAGYYASDFRDTAYTGLIADALATAYGDGGSGWIDSAWESFFFLPEASGQVTTTGAWTVVNGGPNFAGRRPTVAGNGATVTSPFRGTTLDMVQRRGSGFGQWTYSIDGAAAVAVSAANATGDIHTTTVTGLSAGDHTVTQTASSGDCRLFGVRGRNATGVVLDRYCRPSAAYVNTAASFNLLASADGVSGGTTLSTTLGMHSGLDLVICALGLNDALNTEVTTAGLETVLHTLWDTARRLGPGGDPPLFVVVLAHLGKHDDADTSPEYTRVVSTLRGWADAIGAAVVDVWAEGRRSWSYWSGLGAWGDLLGSEDAVHLSDTGHALMAASTIDLLTD